MDAVHHPTDAARSLPSSLLRLLVVRRDSNNATEGMKVESTIDNIDLGGVNVDMDMDMGPYLLRVIWVLGALSTALLGLRLYSKLWRRRPLWWDDWVLVAAWVSFSFFVFFFLLSSLLFLNLLFSLVLGISPCVCTNTQNKSL